MQSSAELRARVVWSSGQMAACRRTAENDCGRDTSEAGGPLLSRRHAMTRFPHSVAALAAVMPLVLTAQQTIAAGGAATRPLAGSTIAVVVAGRAMDEAFTFALGSQQLAYAAGSWNGMSYETPKTFGQPIPRGTPYTVTQTAGPRPCRLTNSTGTAGDGALHVFADCKQTPSTFTVTVRAAGTANGETVSFAMDGAERTDLAAPVRQGAFSRAINAGSTVRVWTAGSPAGRTCAIAAAEPWVARSLGDTLVIRAYSDIVVTTTCTAAAAPPTTGTGAGTGPGTTLAGGRGTGAIAPPRTRLPVSVGPRSGSMSSLTGTLRGPVGARASMQINGSGAALAVTVPPFSNGTDRYNEQNFTFTPARANGTPYSVTASSAGSNLRCTPYQGATGVMPQAQAGLRVGCETIFAHIGTNSAGSVRATFYESKDAVVGGASDPVGGTSLGYGEGRFVAFMSGATGLVNRPVKTRQIYWHDRLTGETRLLSAAADGTPGDGDSFAPSISADGLTVAFESHATNLVPGDGNKVRDVFVWSALNSSDPTSLTRISVGSSGVEGNADSYEPTVSGDGRVIAYTSSASNLTTGVTGTSTPNVFRRDLQGSQTTLVTRGVKGTAVGGSKPSISEDGARIAFQSVSGDLVTGDANGLWDIFVSDQASGVLTRVSRPFGGAERDQGSESASREVAPVISGDGNVVAFATTATNLVTGDRNGFQDVFVVDVRSGRVQRASVTSAGVEADGNSPVEQGGRLALSFNGEWVVFASSAKNLGAPEGNVFMHNNATGETRPVTRMTNNSPSGVSITRTAAYIAFGSNNQYDPAARASGLFVTFTGLSRAFMWVPDE